MSAIGKYLRGVEGGQISFFCPACKCGHTISVAPGHWTYNGNAEKPSFMPSVLLRSGHYASFYKPGDSCWCTFNEEERANGKPDSGFFCQICHLFVTDGRIQFLSDCTHALAGQSVNLSAWEN